MEAGQIIFIEYSGYLLSALAVLIVLRCALPMLRRRRKPEVWGTLELPDGSKRSIKHWESILGRAESADIVFKDASVARSHAAILYDGSGNWTVTPMSRKTEVRVGGARVQGPTPLHRGNKIRLGELSLKFSPAGHPAVVTSRSPVGPMHGVTTLLLVSLWQLAVVFQHCLFLQESLRFQVILAFGLLTAMEWSYYFLMRYFGLREFEPETIAFFLTAIGFSVVATAAPETMLKECLLFLGALVVFLLLGLWLRDLGRVRKLRWLMGGLAIGFLALTLLTSEEIWGARNWLIIAGQSLQPSEFVKIAYIYAGAATLDRLFRRRNLLLFIAFSAVCVATLALMGDFGTALVFFVAFLVISFLRSGSFTTVILAIAAAVLAVMLVLTVRPYVAQRFMSWGHVWEDPLGAGYQQVRAMSALAAGGLFGRGAGAGWLQRIVAADTDLVFALVCEELGLIVGISAVLSILLLAVFTVRCASVNRSSYYAIASCAAVTVYMIQMSLNVFGSLDLLPFTGVTFPFISRGGSSLIACWGLLAFIKTGDTQPQPTIRKLPPRPAAVRPKTEVKSKTETKPAAAKKPAPGQSKPAAAKKPAPNPARKVRAAGKGGKP